MKLHKNEWVPCIWSGKKYFSTIKKSGAPVEVMASWSGFHLHYVNFLNDCLSATQNQFRRLYQISHPLPKQTYRSVGVGASVLSWCVGWIFIYSNGCSNKFQVHYCMLLMHHMGKSPIWSTDYGIKQIKRALNGLSIILQNFLHLRWLHYYLFVNQCSFCCQHHQP